MSTNLSLYRKRNKKFAFPKWVFVKSEHDVIK